jgi:photosynthetic reaction center H subunit
MFDPILAGRLDVAELVFYAFVLFFIALVFYLRREDRREGYPVEDEITGVIDSSVGPFTGALSKTFFLPHNRGFVTTPTKGREPVDIAALRIDRFGGAPYQPVGDPLVDGIGPAAYADRAPWPDLDSEGRLRVVPISTDDHFTVASRDPDPRGMTMLGSDDRVAGIVTDLWIDRSDRMIRYLEVQLDHGARQVLVPYMMIDVDGRRRAVKTDSIAAHQFVNAPALAVPGEITRLEEERVMAYFGGGYLYANAQRAEPLI